MIVVSNTSPVLNLACVGELQVLNALYGRIFVPASVAGEIDRLRRHDPRFANVALPAFVEVVSEIDTARVAALELDLDRGEAEAISLAVDLKADLVLIDERRGRAATRRLGLIPFGLLGILLEARQRNVLRSIKPVLARLQTEAGFWMSDELTRRVLAAAGEN
jgi:predicted nucleic acid-binding protein